METESVIAQPGAGLRQRVLNSLAVLLPRVLGREIPAISGGTLLRDGLGLRSTTMLELLLELEADLDIEIDVEEIDAGEMHTVGDLATFVAGHSTTAS
jgi:acyl carrier protein